MVFLKFIFAMLFGYLVGSINPAYVIGRMKGFDIRKTGTGNAGATNTALTIGAASGVLVMVIDILKMVFVLWVVEHSFPKTVGLVCCTAIATLLGHCYPFYLNFDGGKGMASYFGVIVYSLPLLAMLISFFIYWASSAVILFVLKKKKFVTIVAPLVGMMYFVAFAPTAEYCWTGCITGVVLSLCNVHKAFYLNPAE